MKHEKKNGSEPIGKVEHINPREFIMHPEKDKLQVKLDEKSPEIKAAMDNAFKLSPVPVLPVVYTLIEIDGVERMAIIDGEARVSYAIQYDVEKIPAIRIDLDNTNRKETMRKMLVVNQGYHGSCFEQGKAASELFKEYAPGQGSRTDMSDEKTDDINSFIAATIGGDRMSGDRAKKLRLVYDYNPTLLQQVDNGDVKSVNVAYKMVVRKKKGDSTPTDTTYEDGQEMVLSTETDGEGDYSSDTTAEDEYTETDTTLPADDGDTEVTYTDKQDDEPRGLPEITIMLPRDKDWFVAQCPCCGKEIKLKFIK